MLTLSVQRQLVELTAAVYRVLDGVQSQVTKEEITQHVAEARRKLDDLIEAAHLTPSRSFANLDRHLYWLQRFYFEDKPDRYALDIRDIRSSDLPGIIKAVEEQHSGPLDPELRAAVSSAWDARQYAGVIRDAFIHLEAAIRGAGHVEPSRGLSGDKLVTAVLNPSNNTHVELIQDTFLGALTRGEAEGYFNLVKGAFLLFRNSAAHRSIDVTPGQAEDVVRLVNLCLLFLPDLEAPDTNPRLSIGDNPTTKEV